MPWLRPMVGVSLCSSARVFSAARSRSRSASRMSAGLDELDGEAGVQRVRRGHALMDEPRLLPHLLGKLGQEGDHVVFGFGLDLIDPGDPFRRIGLVAPLPHRLRGFGGDDAGLGQCVAGMGLDLEHDAEHVLGRPDGGHFGSAVTRDHDGLLTLRRLISLGRPILKRGPPSRAGAPNLLLPGPA